MVDTPDGPIFVLLTLPDAKGSLQGYVCTALLKHPSNSPDGFIADVGRLRRAGEGEFKGNLPPDVWPLMVRFSDIADPKSVERVDPGAAGVTRITVETTRDPVTTGIQKRFHWWSQYRYRHFDGTSTVSQDMTTKDLAAEMSSGSFSTEFNR